MAADEDPRPLEFRRSGSPQPLPRGTTTIGVWLFLLSLGMLFAASLLGYILIRFSNANPAVNNRPIVPLGSLKFPKELWISTALVIGVSVALWRAVVAVGHERQAIFRKWLTVSLVLAAGFIAVQTPAMVSLISTHKSLRATGSGTALYGLIFVLVLLHALHVVGGIVGLVRVIIYGFRGQFDHEHYAPVRHVAMYWHFLDGVWVVMFSTFWLTG